MEALHLQENETVLYKKENCIMLQKDRQRTTASSELVLTNLNLILIHRIPKLFSHDQIDIEKYPIENLKIYQGIPQIKQNGTCVEIYLLSHEISINLRSAIEAKKFINKAYELITGKSFSERTANKVKSGFDLVDDTLEMDTRDTLKNVIKNGVFSTLLGKKHNEENKKESIKETIANIRDTVTSKKQSSSENTNENLKDNIETLKKLKELVDTNIITQEEFEQKKKELLNL